MAAQYWQTDMKRRLSTFERHLISFRLQAASINDWQRLSMFSTLPERRLVSWFLQMMVQKIKHPYDDADRDDCDHQQIAT